MNFRCCLIRKIFLRFDLDALRRDTSSTNLINGKHSIGRLYQRIVKTLRKGLMNCLYSISGNSQFGEVSSFLLCNSIREGSSSEFSLNRQHRNSYALLCAYNLA